MCERDLISLQYYSRAKDALFLKDTKRAIKLFCDTFYMRATKEDEIDLEFHDFFLYQFSTYLLGKKRIKVSLPEGDMIASLIKDSYEEFLRSVMDSPFNIGAESLWVLMQNVKLDFPYQNIPEILA